MITRNAVKSWERVKEILHAALELKNHERARFLDRACAGDVKLRAEIESLLAGEDESENKFEELSGNAAVKSFAVSNENRFAGERLGAYRLTKEIGAGGMGVVYLAERIDGEFEQKVAVKLIRRGFDRQAILRKFRLERQILARLNHPNIAQLHDGGTSGEGLPYLVMEYVEGVSIDEYCRDRDCTLEERLELFCKVVGAVSYAHQRLVVHRDLKPSNILVTGDGTPKLLDFGIAKLLENENAGELTETINRQLTPQYASPEQIRGEAIGTASDVYSLGVILYELLTGAFPYRVKTGNPLELARAIAEQEPVKPSSAAFNAERGTRNAESKKAEISKSEDRRPKTEEDDKISHFAFRNSQLKGDVDNIVLKALEKDVLRRYASAEQLSEDIRRYLEGLPIKARQNNWRYRSGKFVRRNLFAVSAAALILLVLTGGIVATSYQTVAARRERALAEKRFDDVRRLSNSFLFEFHDAVANLSGATKARQLVVSRALEYLNNLSGESSDDPTLRAEIAEAYRRLGEIQGHPSFPNLGDTAGAVESFGKARSIGEELARIDQTNKDFRFKLAGYNDMLGDMMERAVYDTPAALRYYTASLDIKRGLIAEDAANPKYLNALSLSYERVGNIQTKTGDRSGAYKNYAEALKISRQLLENDPENRDFQRGLCLSHYDLANLLLADGKYEQALEHFENGRRLAEQRSAEDGADADARRMLGIFDDLMSRAYSSLGDSTRAFEHARRSLALREKLFAAEPTNIQVYGDFTVSLDTVGELEAASGRADEGLAKLRRSLEMREAALRLDPAMTLARRYVAVSRNKIGKVLLRNKNTEAALAEFRQALAANLALSEKDRTNLDFSRELADSYANTGEALFMLAQKSGNSNEAENLRREARETRRKALDILVRMKENNTFFGADAPMLERLSRDTEPIE